MLDIKSRQTQVMFVILVVTLIFIGSPLTIDLPPFFDKLFEHYLTKIIILSLIAMIGNYSVYLGILLSILFILVSQKIVDNNIKKEVKKVTNGSDIVISDSSNKQEKNIEEQEKNTDLKIN